MTKQEKIILGLDCIDLFLFSWFSIQLIKCFVPLLSEGVYEQREFLKSILAVVVCGTIAKCYSKPHIVSLLAAIACRWIIMFTYMGNIDHYAVAMAVWASGSISLFSAFENKIKALNIEDRANYDNWSSFYRQIFVALGGYAAWCWNGNGVHWFVVQVVICALYDVISFTRMMLIHRGFLKY